MPSQEKQKILNTILTLIISGGYFLFLFQDDPLTRMTTDELLRFWAKAILMLVPIAIVGHIIAYIIFAIANRMITGEDLKDAKMDERDKQIEPRSARIGQYLFILGVMGSMGALALDYSVNHMFIILIVSGMGSGIIENLASIYYYKRGF